MDTGRKVEAMFALAVYISKRFRIRPSRIEVLEICQNYAKIMPEFPNYAPDFRNYAHKMT